MYTHKNNPYGEEFKRSPNLLWVIIMLVAVAGFAYLGYQIPHHLH